MGGAISMSFGNKIFATGQEGATVASLNVKTTLNLKTAKSENPNNR